MYFRRVFHYYWPQVKKYKWSFLLTFFFYGVGTILAYIITPYLYKKIIDLISISAPELVDLKRLFYFVSLVVVNITAYLIIYRLGDYLIVYFQSNAMREIRNDTFRRLIDHSYKFFSNNFAGSLVTKAKRFVSSFETMHDMASFNFWSATIQLLGVFIVLFLNSTKLGMLFLAWAVVYIFITFLFIRKKISYDLLEAAADSKVTGRLADSITNILNIKVFSGKSLDKKIFENATRDEYLKRKKAWNFGNLQNTIQGFLMGGLEIAILYLTIDLWLKGSITTGTLVLAQFYMVDIFHRLWELGRSLSRFFK